MRKTTTYTNVVKNFTDLSEKTEANLQIPPQVTSDTGSAMYFLNVELSKQIKDAKVSLKQTFSYSFSDPEMLFVSTGLEASVERFETTDFYLHFWNRTAFERLLGRNRILSGNTQFDRKYSARSNVNRAVHEVFRHQAVQEIFLSNPFLVFNVSCEKDVLRIKLKNMNLNAFSMEEMKQTFVNMLQLDKVVRDIY